MSFCPPSPYVCTEPPSARGGAGGRARRKHGSIRAQLQVAASGRPGQLRATEGLHCLDDDSFFNTGNGKPCSGKETTTEWLQDQGPGAVLWPLTHEAPGSRHQPQGLKGTLGAPGRPAVGAGPTRSGLTACRRSFLETARRRPGCTPPWG